MDTAVILRTAAAPCLVLRPWCAEDIAALVEVHRDPVLRRWITSVVDSEAEATRWVRTQQQGWAAGTRFAFAILDEAGSRLVGHAVLKDVAPGSPAAEVGYWTAAPARGQGVAPRALEVLTGWAFDTFGLNQLELLHNADNLASCRVAQKTGYDFDSILPAAPPSFPYEGHRHVRRRIPTSAPDVLSRCAR